MRDAATTWIQNTRLYQWIASAAIFQKTSGREKNLTKHLKISATAIYAPHGINYRTQEFRESKEMFEQKGVVSDPNYKGSATKIGQALLIHYLQSPNLAHPAISMTGLSGKNSPAAEKIVNYLFLPLNLAKNTLRLPELFFTTVSNWLTHKTQIERSQGNNKTAACYTIIFTLPKSLAIGSQLVFAPYYSYRVYSKEHWLLGLGSAMSSVVLTGGFVAYALPSAVPQAILALGAETILTLPIFKQLGAAAAWMFSLNAATAAGPTTATTLAVATQIMGNPIYVTWQKTMNSYALSTGTLHNAMKNMGCISDTSYNLPNGVWSDLEYKATLQLMNPSVNPTRKEQYSARGLLVAPSPHTPATAKKANTPASKKDTKARKRAGSDVGTIENITKVQAEEGVMNLPQFSRLTPTQQAVVQKLIDEKIDVKNKWQQLNTNLGSLVAKNPALAQRREGIRYSTAPGAALIADDKDDALANGSAGADGANNPAAAGSGTAAAITVSVTAAAAPTSTAPTSTAIPRTSRRHTRRKSDPPMTARVLASSENGDDNIAAPPAAAQAIAAAQPLPPLDPRRSRATNRASDFRLLPATSAVLRGNQQSAAAGAGIRGAVVPADLKLSALAAATTTAAGDVKIDVKRSSDADARAASLLSKNRNLVYRIEQQRQQTEMQITRTKSITKDAAAGASGAAPEMLRLNIAAEDDTSPITPTLGSS